MRVYWELDWSDEGQWVASANPHIQNRQTFLTVTEAVHAFLEDGGSAGMCYRLVREDGTPLFLVDDTWLLDPEAF